MTKSVYIPILFATALLFAFFGCAEDRESIVETCDDCISSYSRFPEFWALVDYSPYVSSFFGDTTRTEWPDNVVEIGHPETDTLLEAMRITFPLIDTISGAWYRDYLTKTSFIRSFRLVVANNDTMDVDSVFIQITTETENGELYGDIQPVNMVFHQVEKLDDRIYFQNYVKKGEERGKPVFFSGTPANVGDFDEAYVLVIKEKTDRLRFRYVLKPEPIIAPEDTCKKVEYCRYVDIPFSERRCSSDSAESDSSKADSTNTDVIETSNPVDSLPTSDSTVIRKSADICVFIDGIRNEMRCDSVCKEFVPNKEK